MNYLHGKPYRLRNISTCDDATILRSLLDQISHDGVRQFHCGASGMVARSMMVILATTPGVHILTGDSRLIQRPMNELIEALNGMGFNIHSLERDGFLPVRIEGTIPRRKMAYIDPSRSSQFVSALMLVAAEMPEGMTLCLTQRAVSRPYVEMTRSLLESVGIRIKKSSNGRNYTVEHRDNTSARSITIEADWSAASAFFTAAALLPGERLRLKGLMLPSIQGDSALADFFKPLGVDARCVHSPYKGRVMSVTVVRSGVPEMRYRANFSDYPDLFPAVSVACAALGVDARLSGLSNLKYKESDRLHVVQDLLTAMGCKMSCSENELHLFPSQLHAVDAIDTYNDHRIAMTFAPLLFLFPQMRILHPEVVDKSFPGFWNQFARLQKVVR